MYFTVSVKVSSMDDKGKVKKTTERYLVDAMSVTEAEARVTKALEYMTNDFEIVAASTSRIIEVVTPATMPKVYAK